MITAQAAGDVFDVPRGWVDHRGNLYCVEHGEDRPEATPEYGNGIEQNAQCEFPGCAVVLYESPEWRRRIEQAARNRTNDGQVRY